jgi:hypothetical protein
MAWIDQVQDGKKWWVAVNTVIKLRCLKMEEFDRGAMCFSRRTLLHEYC